MTKRTERQLRALSRLETQLVSGTKIAKKTAKSLPLTEGDKKRIEKEIDILKKNK